MNTDKLHVYGCAFMAARLANMYEKKKGVYRKLLKKNLKWELREHKCDNGLGKHKFNPYPTAFPYGNAVG